MTETASRPLARIERHTEIDRRIWDVLAADDDELPMLMQAMRVERALDDCPRDADSLADLARMR